MKTAINRAIIRRNVFPVTYSVISGVQRVGPLTNGPSHSASAMVCPKSITKLWGGKIKIKTMFVFQIMALRTQ